MKTNQQVQPVISEDFSVITFNLSDGGAAPVLHMERVSAAIKARAACVGLAQVRVVDCAAVSRTDKDGNIRSTAEMLRLKREGIERMIAHLESGTEEWSRVGEGGGAKSLTIEAVANLQYGGDYARAEAGVDRMAETKHGGDRKACLAFLRTSGRVMAEMDRLRKARAPKPTVDADAALAELAE